MTRIIAGAAGGLRLKSVPGTATRPTTDRAKESLFSRLDAWGMCTNASVLDLFAGSGALGLEAASRGAKDVTLVEKASSAARTCRANAAILSESGLSARITTTQTSAQQHLNTVSNAQWDLVFVDPPYPMTNPEVSELLASLRGRLGPGAVIVVERSVRTPEPQWPQGLQRFERSTHGETVLWYVEEHHAPDADSPDAQVSDAQLPHTQLPDAQA